MGIVRSVMRPLEGCIVRLEPLAQGHFEALAEAAADPEIWRWMSGDGSRREIFRAEIGHTWLARSHWGSGANVEAKLLMLEHAFGPMAMRRVEFKTDALNERSRRALEALPAQFEGIHRQHMLVREGENRDSAWYSIVDAEWPLVRANLLRRLGRPA
jgi:hypothetical protein